MKKLLTAILVFTVITFVQAQKDAFSVDAIYKVKGVGAPAVAPGEKKIAYTVTEFTLKGGKSKTAVYLYDVEANASQKVDLGEKSVGGPFWGNTDDVLYYYKSVEGYSQLFSYTFSTKESKQITKYFSGISSALLSPDGKQLLFSTDVFADCNGDEDCNKKSFEGRENGPVQAYLSDDLLFRHWTSYTEGKVSHLFLMDMATGTYKDITPFTYNCPVFSVGGGGLAFGPDSKTLCYVANPEEKKANSTNSDIWLYDIAKGSVTNITAENKAWDGDPAYSPDGKYIAYRLQKQPGYESDRFRIALYDIAAKSAKVVTESFDNWINDIVWAPDSKSLYFTADVKSFTPIFNYDLAIDRVQKVSPDRGIGSFSMGGDGKKLYYTARLMHRPVDIYQLNMTEKKETQITFWNKEVTEKYDFRPAQHMWITGADGKKVHVLLVTPHDFDPSKKYPLVVNVHGGPQSQWMDAYRPDAQVYSGYGYIVAFPNPHGSTGYGQDYTAAISGDWGGKTYTDVMMVTDSLAKLPYVDASNIGAMGWSYGGYMMNWLQANTKRFKCLVSMMGLYNITSFYGTTEELWFPEWDMKGTPWDNPKLYEKYSPSNYVKNFSTPTLIITGEKDLRVSYTQSLEYFTALKKQNVDSRIIVFKNDGHWPSHIKSMPLYYNAHLEWFSKYLGGKPAPYDSKKLVRNIEDIKE